MAPNESPVNFFNPDLDNYPLFEDVGRKYTVVLHESHCIFIPAFYFYQYVAKAGQAPDVKGIKPSALTISLKYKTNSELLKAFMEAIELKLID